MSSIEQDLEVEIKKIQSENLIREEQATKTEEKPQGKVLKAVAHEGDTKPHAPKDHYVAAELKAKADLFNERAALYGDNYMRFGHIMKQLLHVQMLDPMDHHAMNRLGIFVQIVSKLTRYGENFTAGGHDDSLDDIAVYAMMLKSLDNFGKE